MSNVPPNGEGHAAEIFGTHAYEAARPAKKNFSAWHRPRKQFVRDRQWCNAIKDLLEDIFPDGGGVLKYLGLPGVDLLDLRYFHTQVCVPHQRQLSFLGFNTAAHPDSDAEIELNISLDEVRKLPFVDPRSNVLWDDFRRIANAGSIAARSVREHGPFDVVNLDLCDGFGSHEPCNLSDTHYSAVNNIISLQSRRKHPWLLLLTTRAGQPYVHATVLEKLLQKYVENLECVPFRTASHERFAIESEARLRAAAATTTGMLPVFITGLCKWILGLATSYAPPSKLKVGSVICYRVVQEAECEDLVSLLLRFEPTFAAVPDPLGLANHPPQELNECELALRALEKVASRKNADEILANNAPLQAEMISATAALLESARYDVTAFHSWLEND